MEQRSDSGWSVKKSAKKPVKGADTYKTAAAYIRVSTEDQMEFSPDSQMKRILEYAKSRDIIIPEKYFFIDEGISGKYAKTRPEFMRMIGTAKQKPKPFDVILVWKFSRFSRNRQDSIFYKSMLRKECGIDVISITEQLSDDPTSILIEALLEAMDEYYSINLAEEVKRGMNEKFTRGGVVSIPPYGYRMGETCFEIEEEQAKYVRIMYQELLNGTLIQQIAQKVNQLGARTKRGNLFEKRTVEYILKNPVYIGMQRRDCQKEKMKKSDAAEESRMLIVPAGHEPIIDKGIFEKVQKRLQVYSKKRKR